MKLMGNRMPEITRARKPILQFVSVYSDPDMVVFHVIPPL